MREFGATGQPHLIHLFISHLADAFKIAKGQWLLMNFYASFSSVSLLREMLHAVTVTVNVKRTSNAVTENASLVG